MKYEEHEISYEGNTSIALKHKGKTIAGNKELAIEKLVKAAKAMFRNGTVKPFVIAVSKGKPKVVQLEKNSSGQYVLPTIKNISTNDLKKKRKIVDKLMKKISPILKADIEKVTFIALMRKDETSLKEALEMVTVTKEKPKLVNRLGCIFIEVGDEDFQI